MKTIPTLALAALVVGLTNSASAQSYSITDLSAGSGYAGVEPYGISQNGKITGILIFDTGEIHAFIYSNGTFQDLGLFTYPYGTDGIAINNAGQVAGTGYGPGYHAYLYSNGHAHALGSIDGGSSSPWAMNNAGHIVGRAVNGDGGGQGFTYFGTFAALPVDIARGINDSDQVAGSMSYTWVYGGYVHAVEHAFVLTGGTYTDLGDLGGGVRTNTEAYAINNSGFVTGYSTTATGELHAFLFTGEMNDLGTIPPYYTIGVSINNLGDVVGTIETYVGGPVGAFLYTNGTLHDLMELIGPAAADWSDLSVTQINDAGWIVGTGTINGESHGFVLKPLCPGDLNADGAVDLSDLALLLSSYGCNGPGCTGDLNGDGVTDLGDLAVLLSHYGGSNCP